LCHY